MDFEIEEEILMEDDLDLLEVIDYGFPRRVYERLNYFCDLDDLTFFRRFRLLKPTVLNILKRIEDQLEYPHDLNNSVSPMNQLLTGLRFYASDGHLSSVGDYMGIHESTASGIIKRVTTALAGLYRDFVKMPTPEEFVGVQIDFYNMSRFPSVLGVLDETHIKIQNPGRSMITPFNFLLKVEMKRKSFVTEKNYFSVNTQVICDANLKSLDVVARWPGSAHDNTIFNNSRIRRKFEQGFFPNCILLGDSGYGQRNFLLTPLGTTVTYAQRLYNEAHIRTRNVVERAIGVWKRRFPVLAYGLRLKMDTVLTLIPVMAVLQNIAKVMHEPDPPIPFDMDPEMLNYLIEMGEIPDVPQQAEEAGGTFFKPNQ